MLFRVREFRPGDFEALWRIDQVCFAPGISYSADELRYYIRRKGAFTLVAETEETPAETVLEAAARELGSAPAARSRNSDTLSALEKGTEDESIPEHILGFVVAEASAEGFGHIITIDVRQHARRFGIGSALMQTTEERFRGLGCSRIYLETAVDNPGALAFYKRRSYELIKTRPRYYSNGVDALVLRKLLG